MKSGGGAGEDEEKRRHNNICVERVRGADNYNADNNTDTKKETGIIKI